MGEERRGRVREGGRGRGRRERERERERESASGRTLEIGYLLSSGSLAIGLFSLHARREGEASSALRSSPQSGPRASTASRVCPAPKQLTEPWPRPSRCLSAAPFLSCPVGLGFGNTTHPIPTALGAVSSDLSPIIDPPNLPAGYFFFVNPVVNSPYISVHRAGAGPLHRSFASFHRDSKRWLSIPE